MKNIYLNLSNFNSYHNIQDFIDRLLDFKLIKKSTGHYKDINIFIENFKDKDLKNIKKIKSSGGKVIILLTEFFNEKYGILNNWKINNIVYWTIINVFFLIQVFYLKIKKKEKKKNLKKKQFYNSNRISFLNNLMTILSFKRRFINLKKALRYCDFLILAHPKIDNKVLKNINQTLFPYKVNINKIKAYKKTQITFSGSLTKDRINFFEKKIKIQNFDNYLKKNFKTNIIKKKETFIKFDMTSNDNLKVNYLNLSPKKFANWKFSNPMKVIRSINNYQIPIFFDRFQDNFLSELYIHVKSEEDLKKVIENKKKYISGINKNLNKYKKNIFKKYELNFINSLYKIKN